MKPAGVAALVLVPVLLLAWLYTRTPEGDARIRGAFHGNRAPGPAVGTRVEAPELMSLTRPAWAKGWLLLQVGACSECLAAEVAAWERAARRRAYRIVVVTTSDDATQQRLRAAAKLEGEIVLDRDGSLAQKLGGSFTPRAFLFDRAWRLRAVQRRPFPDPEDPMRDPGLAGAAG